MADAVIISGYGQSEFEAVTLANQPWFIFTVFMFGLSTGACVLTSQYYGGRDNKSISAVMLIGLGFSLLAGLVFTGMLYFAPGSVLRLYTNEPRLVEMGSGFLKIIAPSYFLSAITILYASYLKSVEKAALPLVFTGISLAANIALDFALIFGLFGFPRMGLLGAALGTLIARILETAVMCFYFVKYEKHIRVKPDFAKVKKLFPDFIKYSGPVILNEAVWGVGASMHSAIFGRMGETVIAAYGYVSVLDRLGAVAYIGLSQAAAVILGIELGNGNLETARKYGKYYLSFAALFGFVCGLLVYAATPLAVRAFGMAPETAEVYRRFALVMAVFFTVKSFNMLGICSILRSGGDSTAALLIDVFLMWSLTNPLGWVLGVNLGWSAVFVYIALISEEVLKMPIMIFRVKQGKWLRQLT
jgi:putative MATE family efflux protein